MSVYPRRLVEGQPPTLSEVVYDDRDRLTAGQLSVKTNRVRRTKGMAGVSQRGLVIEKTPIDL
jgi:hypothetical protein